MDDQKECLLEKNDQTSKENGYKSITEPGQVDFLPQIEIDIGKSDAALDIKLYGRRWYVLAIYSLLAATNGCIWNTWGPIAKASEDAFGWTDSDIALLSNWGAIMYVVAAAPMSWLTDTKGLRWACIVASMMIAGSTGLRCISDSPPLASWLIHTAQIVKGLAGPICCAVPPVLSATWFPAHQRTTATAIAAVSNYLGIAIGFIFGPYMVVTEPKAMQNFTNESMGELSSPGGMPILFNSTNNTGPYMVVTEPKAMQNFTNASMGELSSPGGMPILFNSTNNTDYILQERKDIMLLMYVEAGWALFLLLVILIYFPAKPPKPPSITACIGRLSFGSSIKILLKNKQFWLIGMTYFIPQGVNQCWASVLDVNLKSHGITQKEAGWLGFYGVIAGTSASLIIARFSDIFSKHIKWFLLGVMVPAAGFYLWFTLIFIDEAPANTASIYSSVILGGLFLMCGPPLFFEMTSEITFPVPEAVSVFLLTLMFNLSGAVFLGIQMIPNIGTAWQNWMNVGCIIACIPLLLLFKESYNRLAIDEAQKT